MPRKYGVPQKDRVPKYAKELSPQLRQVLALKCQGHSHRQVAESLGLTEKTAGVYWRQALERIPGLDLEALDPAQQLEAAQRWWREVVRKEACAPC